MPPFLERRAVGSVLRKSILGVPLLFAWLFLFIGCSQNPQVSQARLTLAQESYDFGTITVTQPVVKELEFTNTGTEPLLIRDVLPVPPPGGVG